MAMRLTAFAVAVAVVIAVVLGVQSTPLVNRIQRDVQQNWVIGILAAVIVSCTIAKQVWEFRNYLRVWLVCAGFLGFHFFVFISVLGKLGTIRYGHIEAAYLWVMAVFEGLAICFILNWVSPRPPKAASGRPV